MPSIGLLWDMISNNTGDKAIGLVLQRAFARAKIPARAIDPFHPDLADICTLVIGGGELIRSPGHPYYDVFRAPGRHILNTVGVLDGMETSYLDDYRLVSVRSQADRARLGRGDIVPCLTLLYEDYLEPEIGIPHIPAGAIGININYGFIEQIEPLINWLKTSSPGPLVWLPITCYNADEALLRELANHIPGSICLPQLSPDMVFKVIGKLSAFVSSSLHGALFAYAQGVPVLGQRAIGKLAAFLDERNLSEAVFETADDIERELPRLIETPPELTERRHKDQALCREWLGQVLAEAERTLVEPQDSRAIQLTPANERYHQLEMRYHDEIGRWAAANVHLALQDVADHAQIVAPDLANWAELADSAVARMLVNWLWRIVRGFRHVRLWWQSRGSR